MKIVITGSLGNIGQPLGQELIKQGHTVTLISSNPERKMEIERLKATAAIGFLAVSFSEADAVYCMILPNYEQQDQIKYYKIIGESYKRVILETKVKRIVHLSGYEALGKWNRFIAAYHRRNSSHSLH
ncbi:SDR family oxidoreductase [Chryseobacterium geocarposphaerae]|uniref:NAD(P)-binding protein n=1 Tax=Chryseobacterium geocarposphaerae TaxID=1416776 RepID=A0A2M9C700_9FLAO|nr:hypothetical protein [Chryseobacterium geocarposphaerae]PJJ66556.1 hypothetical protein CLV73_0543 [Chryseobacterium geocarposphaerae]